eukprot:gene5134-3685_t
MHAGQLRSFWDTCGSQRRPLVSSFLFCYYLLSSTFHPSRILMRPRRGNFYSLCAFFFFDFFFLSLFFFHQKYFPHLCYRPKKKCLITTITFYPFFLLHYHIFFSQLYEPRAAMPPIRQSIADTIQIGISGSKQQWETNIFHRFIILLLSIQQEKSERPLSYILLCVYCLKLYICLIRVLVFCTGAGTFLHLVVVHTRNSFLRDGQDTLMLQFGDSVSGTNQSAVTVILLFVRSLVLLTPLAVPSVQYSGDTFFIVFLLFVFLYARHRSSFSEKNITLTCAAHHTKPAVGRSDYHQSWLLFLRGLSDIPPPFPPFLFHSPSCFPPYYHHPRPSAVVTLESAGATTVGSKMFYFFDLAFSLEVLVVVVILMYVPYTEIDWRTYMEQVAQVLDGQMDYTKIEGGTGPLVYPAGFTWLFSGLYLVTKGGLDVSLAQCIFAAVYLCTLGLTLRLHRVARVSFLYTIPLFLSRRLRSLYLLRLFNDCWAVFFALLAVLRLSTTIPPSTRVMRYRYWYWGTLLMSVAISIKMNILLFCPGLLCIMVYTLPVTQIVVCGLIGVSWQLFIAAPFLLQNPEGYLSRAFELRRVFQHRWSVNYQFLPAEIFKTPPFHAALLVATVAAYALVWRWRWRKRCIQTRAAFAVLYGKGNGKPGMAQVKETTCLPHVLTLLESNVIGFAFSRSMHYQFYTWIFFSLLFVLYHTRLPAALALSSFWAVQYGFEVYPPTPQSSVAVMAGTIVAVISIIFLGAATPEVAKERGDEPWVSLKQDEEEEEEEGNLNPSKKVVKATYGVPHCRGPLFRYTVARLTSDVFHLLSISIFISIAGCPQPTLMCCTGRRSTSHIFYLLSARPTRIH